MLNTHICAHRIAAFYQANDTAKNAKKRDVIHGFLLVLHVEAVLAVSKDLPVVLHAQYLLLCHV